MTIYLVTSGNYSDYCVDAVFDSKELAEKFIELYAIAKGEECRIEEYPLNKLEKQIRAGHKAFSVMMSKDGNTQVVNLMYPGEFFGPRTYICNDLMTTCCFAKDQPHAVKIANEKRTQLIATNQWKDTY